MDQQRYKGEDICNILDDQMVIVYGTIGLLYDGEWKDAPDDIKSNDDDWYLLANCEEADIVIFAYQISSN